MEVSVKVNLISLDTLCQIHLLKNVSRLTINILLHLKGMENNLEFYWKTSDCPRSIGLLHQKKSSFTNNWRKPLLTFCVVDMLIIVTELDKLLEIGPLQLSIAVSGSYVKIWLTLQLDDLLLQTPPLKVISLATLDTNVSSVLGQKHQKARWHQWKCTSYQQTTFWREQVGRDKNISVHKKNNTTGDGGITVDFWIIKVHR